VSRLHLDTTNKQLWLTTRLMLCFYLPEGGNLRRQHRSNECVRASRSRLLGAELKASRYFPRAACSSEYSSVNLAPRPTDEELARLWPDTLHTQWQRRRLMSCIRDKTGDCICRCDICTKLRRDGWDQKCLTSDQSSRRGLLRWGRPR